jgi:outer membrane cobalamin receptor
MAGILSACMSILLSQALLAQTITGTVKDGSSTSATSPLPGANIRWMGTSIGTSTDTDGKFTLTKPDSIRTPLLISFVGYKTDTIHVHTSTKLNIVLQPGTTLSQVVVEGQISSSFFSNINPIKTETLTGRELQKAACCNLSESFETNASVDVSYHDAITGAKQIQMLGLDGTYAQINTENIPSIRGLATTYGLNYTPGTWVSTIDIGRGAGSVVNGYESITGQINVELQKPEKSEKLFLNTYINSMGRAEININSAHKLNKRWSTGVLLHTSRLGDELMDKMDRNNDGFLDLPMFTQYNAINRWKYEGKRVMAQFGVKALYDQRKGGQVDYYKMDKAPMEPAIVYDSLMGHELPMPGYTAPRLYGTGTTTRRIEAFSKTGLLFPNTPYKGLGLIVSATNHDQESFFGDNTYKGQQRTLYANLIYQTIIGTTNHQIKTGVSYLLDNYREAYRDSAFARTESVPGVFGEYSYTIHEKFTAVAGLRADYHNLYGPFLTPRLHLKYNLTPTTTMRTSVGRGFRVANPIAENMSVLVSSRQLRVQDRLQPEKAWNYGVNLTHEFKAWGREGLLAVDVYRTDFENQVIVDLDTRANEISFYNLKGKSYANNVQIEAQYSPIKALDLKLAYKFYDVKTTINGELMRKQFVSRDKVLFNAAYATRFEKWKFDFTTQWIGSKRIPGTTQNPEGLQRETTSPAYFLFNAQVTKAFRKWDLYVGGENLGGFTQKNPIIAAAQPYGPHFDASLVWAPVFGRMIYAGMRYKIK